MDFIWTNNPKRFKIEKEKIKSMQFEPLCLICKHPEVLLNTEFTDIRFFNVLPMCGFESPSKIDASIFFATSLQNSKYRFCGACCFLYVQKNSPRHSESAGRYRRAPACGRYSGVITAQRSAEKQRSPEVFRRIPQEWL